jgi:hypothetical protein
MTYKIIENYGVEYAKPTKHNLLVAPTTNMDIIEDWENRLKELGYVYAVVLCKEDEYNVGFSILCPKLVTI